ncbi:MAG: dihydrolipoamide acetyltransferase family protein [Pelolinea sp.]|nr:dihydrolipoamide acetyltransferase family protein [Pelolinea sp.]
MAEIVVMPKLDLTMEEGVIVEWNKKLGDIVEAEDVLCSIETEKTVMEMGSPASGILLKIWGVVGERYPITSPIALIGELDEDVTVLINQVENQLAGTSTVGSKAETPADELIISSSPRVQAKMAPKVRKLVKDLGIDLPALVAFCGERKITEVEVRAFQKAHQPAAAAKDTGSPHDRRISMSSMRRTIASNMYESRQRTAQLTNITEVDMTHVMEKLHERKDEKLSLTSLLVKACALAIKDHEIINTELDGDYIIYKADIHIGFAVDVPGGLVVPVIRSADTKNITTLSREIGEFTVKANQNALTQADLTGGTFTVSNVGMLAVDSFTPILNYPQTAIMGVGSVKRLPRFLDNSSDKVVSRYIMNLCLTYDHRVIDGAPAARFSLQVRDLLQNADIIFT